MAPRIFPTFALALVTALITPAAAQVTKSGSGYVFRIKFVQGMTIRYKTAVSMPMAGQMGSFDMPMTRRILKVHQNIADLQVKQGPIEFNGKPVGTATIYKMSIDRQGRAVGDSQTANSGVTMFPPGAIQPGKVWTANLPIAMGALTGDSPVVVAAYRFLRMTTYDGQRVAQLSVSFTKPGGKIPINGKGTVYILASDGNILHSLMSFSVSLQQDADPVKVTAEVSRG